MSTKVDEMNRRGRPIKAKFPTTFRGREIQVEMTAIPRSDTVEVIITFTDRDTGERLKFEKVTRKELAALCHEAASPGSLV